jgi:hypothetical protein
VSPPVSSSARCVTQLTTASGPGRQPARLRPVGWPTYRSACFLTRSRGGPTIRHDRRSFIRRGSNGVTTHSDKSAQPGASRHKCDVVKAWRHLSG